MQCYKFIICALLFGFVLIPGYCQKMDSTFSERRNSIIAQADSLMERYKFQNALDVLSSSDSLDVDVLLRIGECHLRLGASSAAILPYEHVLKIDSTNITALNHLGVLYSRGGDIEKALGCFMQLVNVDPSNSYYYKQAGLMASRTGASIQAKFWFEKALNLNPMDTESSLGLGNILMEMKQYQSVDSIVQQSLALYPEFRPLMILKAKSEFRQRKYQSVIVTINTLMEKADTVALHAKLLGESYFHLGEYHKMFPWMHFLLRNDYEHESIYFYMGIAVREVGDIAGSVAWFKLAVEKAISVNLKVYYSELAESFEQLGDHGEAIRALRIAYNYSKDDILLYNLARNYDIYYEDKATALLYYQKYLESADTIKRAKEYSRKRLQEMGKF